MQHPDQVHARNTSDGRTVFLGAGDEGGDAEPEGGEEEALARVRQGCLESARVKQEAGDLQRGQEDEDD